MDQLLKSPLHSRDPELTHSHVRDTVARIIADVRDRGDSAVREYSEQLDGWSPAAFRLSAREVSEAISRVAPTVIEDFQFVQQQIRRFAQQQRDSMTEFEMETLPGVFLGQRIVPVATAGAYVPGGRYPLISSAHMTIVPAKVAEVPRVAACTPPVRGSLPAATVTAMHLAGADEIYVVGGVQAVAALAFGTESIDPVSLIVGPGNRYVAEAKRQLFGHVGIDLVAGPTEILIIADDSASPFTVAVDLLSQAEHGPDSPAILITTSLRLGQATAETIEKLLPTMPTREAAGSAWRDYGAIHVVDGLDEAFALADCYASEHVEVLTAEPRLALDHLTNYGSLFLGERTCVSFGDKVIGTNHVLPTGGSARYTGGLWVGKYLKTVTYQEVVDPAASAQLGDRCARIARLESFEGHARSGDLRKAWLDGGDLPWAAGALPHQ